MASFKVATTSREMQWRILTEEKQRINTNMGLGSNQSFGSEKKYGREDSDYSSFNCGSALLCSRRRQISR
jgi:hypothetical protein